MNNTIKSDYLQKQYSRLKVSREIASTITGHAVKSCCKTLKSGAVKLKINKEGQAYYYGLFKCGSVWDCPHCSGIIASERRQEIEKALDIWRLSGGSVVLVTYTVQHSLNDRLFDLQKVCNEAYRFTKSGAPYQRLKSRFNIKGSIVANELTYSQEYGWHYHRHEILFYRSDRNIREYEEFVYSRYNSKLNDLGFSSLRGIGVNISDKEGELANYLAKWGLQNELTSTKDKVSGKTPFELLDDPADKDLFIEYSKVMHGVRRLTWSRGMKAFFNIEEIDDDQLIEELEEEVLDDPVLMVILHAEWKYILKHDLYMMVLCKAEQSPGGFLDWYYKNIIPQPDYL